MRCCRVILESFTSACLAIDVSALISRIMLFRAVGVIICIGRALNTDTVLVAMLLTVMQNRGLTSALRLVQI